MCQPANKCKNLSFYYSCFSFMIVSRCFSLSVAHFRSSKKAKLTVTPQYLLELFKVSVLFSWCSVPKIISNFRPCTHCQEGKIRFFWGFVIIIRIASKPSPLWLLFWAACIVLYWNRAVLVSYFVTGLRYCCSDCERRPLRSVTPSQHVR